MTNLKKTIDGQNQVWVSGYIGERVVSGATRSGEPAFSFSVSSINSVAAANGGSSKIFVRVNAYGSVAVECKKNATPGSYCQVVGELMNRSGKFGELTEVRAKNVIFYTPSNQ